MTLPAGGGGAIFQVGIFDPALGGDPVLFQHLFWFYSHPAVYIMILPGMAVVSEIVAGFLPQAIFGYKFVAFASIAIAVIGFLVWGHHMFVAGTVVYSAMVFSHPQLFRGRSLGDQGLQLDAPHFTRLDLAGTRRCSTRSASSDCSPSAA